MDILWALSEIRTPFFDHFFQLVTYLGQELFLISIVCALYWCVDKKLAAQIGFTYVAAGLSVQGLKITFRIPRPWMLDPNFQAVESAIPAATGYSFPSGHTQAGTSLFAPLTLHTKKWGLKCAYTAMFLLIGFSRMYLGCHTPKDVLAAICVSLLAAWIIHRYQDTLTANPRFTGWAAAAVAAFALFICCYAFFLYHGEIIEARYASDCFKASGAALGFAAGWYLEQRYLNFSPEKSHTQSNSCLIYRFLFGLVVTAVLQFSLKALIGRTFAGQMVQHAVVIFWIIYGYPLVFTHFRDKN
ncbi:MAG: phosphatase PAP2 family protein [Coprococcus sp.]|nr:phosphatase PAP2 family protein [Coprococcus sp.]